MHAQSLKQIRLKWLALNKLEPNRAWPFLIPWRRGQLILDWAWPEQSLSKVELNEREGQQSAIHADGQRGLWVRECQGEPGKPYCKTLVLTRSHSDDTGYYRCFYQDVKVVRDGTTAVSVYVFVRGRRCCYYVLWCHFLNLICKALLIGFGLKVFRHKSFFLFFFSESKWEHIKKRLVTLEHI